MKDPLSHRRAGFTLVEFLVTFIIVVLLFSLLASPDLIIHSCFGWYFFLKKTCAEIRFDFLKVVEFTLVSVLFLGLAHYLARSFLPRSENVRIWRFRNSASMLLGLFVSFAAGLAFVGTVHQFGWLAREPKIFHGMREASHRRESRVKIMKMGEAAYSYHDRSSTFPAGGSLLARGVPGHSWQTELLPFIDQQALFNQIDLQQPWFASRNQQPFETEIGLFNSAKIYGMRNEVSSGYAVSYYAENSRLTSLGKPISQDQIRDGMSSTLFAGEVVSKFKPWGDPTNRRDPALGLNSSPEGFGSPWKYTTGFLMADGTVRYIDNDIDPKILEALATPDGGEAVGEF